MRSLVALFVILVPNFVFAYNIDISSENVVKFKKRGPILECGTVYGEDYCRMHGQAKSPNRFLYFCPGADKITMKKIMNLVGEAGSPSPKKSEQIVEVEGYLDLSLKKVGPGQVGGSKVAGPENCIYSVVLVEE